MNLYSSSMAFWGAAMACLCVIAVAALAGLGWSLLTYGIWVFIAVVLLFTGAVLAFIGLFRSIGDSTGMKKFAVAFGLNFVPLFAGLIVITLRDL